jgi:prefoldin subunit 5
MTEPIEQNGNVIKLRISNLETTIEKLENRIAELESHCSGIDVSVAKMSERLTLFQVFQASLSAILSGIAAGVSKLWMQ